MPCYSPVSAFKTASGEVVFAQLGRFDIVGDIKLPCRGCLGCRLDRAQEWTLRVMHEAQLHDENCFLTLTYSDEHLPPGNSLRHADFQKFMKRLRKHVAPKEIRYYMCGEYGELNLRPHFHACIFNHNFQDLKLWQKTDSDHYIYSSPTLEKLWPFGHASVGELNKQTAGYTARYVMKKVTGDLAKTHYAYVDPETGELHHRVPEYNRMSNRPGIGHEWFQRFRTDLYPFDYCVSEGKRNPVPGYYDKLLRRFDQEQYEAIKMGRESRALAHADNNTPERLAVRQEVAKARVRNLKRGI